MPVARRRKREADEMRSEYDFSKGVRGKYAGGFARGSNVVILASDVAAVFRTSKAVNDVLRSYLKCNPTRAGRRLRER
jgi:hypothetical protein